MKKSILLLIVVAVLAMPVLADAGGRGPSIGVQGPSYWHPFLYPGPFVNGYPGGFSYAYPGPYVSYSDATSYTYGYPGPYSYGTWTYSWPHCVLKPNGFWLCS